MAKRHPVGAQDRLDPSIFGYTWQHTRPEQLWLLVITLLSFPFYFISLDLPKQIVNGPIQGLGFEGGTQTYYAISWPTWLGGSGEPLLPGITLERLDALIMLSFVFLALVCINGLFKFYINTQKGRLGERMLRRLRFQLVDRLLRFPLNELKRVRASETASMIKDEVEPLGGFIGNAFIQPVFLLGQALTALIFIMVQSFWLGLMAAAIVAVQSFLIPRLRRRLIDLGRERQLTSRLLAGRVGEIVDGMTEIHTNDASNYERADISDRLGRIFRIRYDIFRWKFFIKFLNNFLAQVTPFLFYLVGGYFALNGQLDIGQLVAVIAAYKDLPSPIKELIDWDQQRLDVQVKYQQVIEQFAPASLLPQSFQSSDEPENNPRTNAAELSHVVVIEDTGAKLAEDITFSFKPGEAIAAVGDLNAGAEAIADALAGTIEISSGALRFSGVDATGLREAVRGRRIGYVNSGPYLPSGSLRDAVLYALKTKVHVAERTASNDMRFNEAVRSGNPTFETEADWINYGVAGLDADTDLDAHLLDIMSAVTLSDDIFDMGLRGKLARSNATAYGGFHSAVAADNEIAASMSKVLAARESLAASLRSMGGRPLVEHFNPDAYSNNLTIAENLLFGPPSDPHADALELCETPAVLEAMAAHQLDETFFYIGRGIAQNIIDLFGDLQPGNPLFDNLAFMTPEQVPAYATLMSRMGSTEFKDASHSRRLRLWRLAFQYIEPRHRFGLLNDDIKKRIVAARATLRETYAKAAEPAVQA
ncbi:MAG: ABC transporter ATP-binding protein, partial [Pseudomonadota bacterium]